MTFEQLYSEHKNLVYNLALSYCQNVEDSEEVTQDVFVAIYKNMSGFKEESSHKTWIYKIAINKSLDFLKARKRKKNISFFASLFSDTSSINQVSNFQHPGIQLEQQEAYSTLFGKINELPENQKTALILSKIEQKSQAEIAEIMDTSSKAVESLLQRAKKNLEIKLSSTKD